MVKAIETYYGGYRFRSRLEARWAVFLDHLGVPWEYEAQGYVTTPRISDPGLDPAEVWYLPDFWLPTYGVFLEVKGSLSISDCIRLIDAAASISSQDAGGCGEGPDVVVAGPIPRDSRDVPRRLHMHKGDLEATPWNPCDPAQSPHDRSSCRLATDYGGDGIFQASELPGVAAMPYRLAAEVTATFLLGGLTSSGEWRPMEAAALAPVYSAARQARFEYGETPGAAVR